MITLGFTGTQRGMTIEQTVAVATVVRFLRPNAAHHGDCLGADAQFDLTAAWYLIPRTAHPGLDANGDSPKRAYCRCETVLDPEPYLVRNRAIVAASSALVGAPSGPEVVRSGTWSTIRHARLTIPTYIAYPDGRITYAVREPDGSFGETEVFL